MHAINVSLRPPHTSSDRRRRSERWRYWWMPLYFVLLLCYFFNAFAPAHSSPNMASYWFHVWAYSLSKAFHLMIYQPNGSRYKLCRPEQSTKFQNFVRYLVLLFKCVRCYRVCFGLWSWSAFVWGRLIRRNENKSGLEHTLSPLSSRFCRRNFPKHSECFGIILVVKIRQSTRIPSQNHPRTFGMFQKVPAAYMSWKEA